MLLSISTFAQPNCEAFKYYGQNLKYEACIAAEDRAGHYQFSRAYQEALDRALLIDSTFAYAYRVKSTAYLKSGDFINWMALMNKAVKFDPKGELFYRGWCRFQFFRDYQGAIDDIEMLDSLVDYDIGFSQNGTYHLHVARALCYKALGYKQKAIKIIEDYMSTANYLPSIYDYLHLGVLYLEEGKIERAIQSFKMQTQENDIAENSYYWAKALQANGKIEKAHVLFQKAKEQLLKGSRMNDPYIDQMDKVYLEQIEAIRK